MEAAGEIHQSSSRHPERTKLIFHELNLDQLRIGLLDLESGAMNFIPLPTRDIAYGSLSPTGERIAAERMESSYTHLVVFPLSGKGCGNSPTGRSTYSRATGPRMGSGSPLRECEMAVGTFTLPIRTRRKKRN